jgi:hypothetical protein
MIKMIERLDVKTPQHRSRDRLSAADNYPFNSPAPRIDYCSSLLTSAPYEVP